MPCLLVLAAFFFPRLVLILLAIFSTYLQQAYSNLVIPILGFFLLPYTTLAYAWAHNSTGGSVGGIHLVVVIVAVLVDLGVLGGGASARRKRVAVVTPR